MSEHTPEPWRTSRNTARPANLDWVLRPGIGGVVTEADARRIVAAVNACAGMEDPEAEIARLRDRERTATKSMAALNGEIGKLRDQVRTAKAHIRDIILSGSGVDVHNIAALQDALAFLGYDSYHALANAELEDEKV